jgi:hypothetical protein
MIIIGIVGKNVEISMLTKFVFIHKQKKEQKLTDFVLFY